ncbi:TIGR02186 family protein [Arenibaculum pallidiluteum]|uniref:TIGR02186 family protein n=1 Tax=Arenibaculum pallidiluteum TaxID=2812559 RepID=UPI002E28032F|nr:TIGR02186 family protein [Arenibaculum pallidiluteum]
MRRAARFSAMALGAILGAGILLAATARAQQLVADLSSHLIAITTGFTGTEVVLFGAVDGPGDVAVVVQGPAGRVNVRRKERIAGIWMNTRSVEFDDVPGYYAVATSRPVERLAEPSVLAREEIGTSNIALVATGAPPGRAAEFREALIRGKRSQGLYPEGPVPVTFLGDRLFRTTIHFPANVPTGAYTVGVFLFRNGQVISAQTTPLVVSKIGFSAEVYEFATRQSLAYGIAAVAVALASGWAAGAVFRRV